MAKAILAKVTFCRVKKSKTINSHVERAWGCKSHFVQVYEIWDAKRITAYFYHLLG